jgi:translation initiation factor IF-1
VGFDASLKVEAVLKVEAIVVDLLPNVTARVKLENQDLVLAHPAAATKANFMRIRPGDRVEVELSPQDRTRGRIVKLLRKD